MTPICLIRFLVSLFTSPTNSLSPPRELVALWIDFRFYTDVNHTFLTLAESVSFSSESYHLSLIWYFVDMASSISPPYLPICTSITSLTIYRLLLPTRATTTCADWVDDAKVLASNQLEYGQRAAVHGFPITDWKEWHESYLNDMKNVDGIKSPPPAKWVADLIRYIYLGYQLCMWCKRCKLAHGDSWWGLEGALQLSFPCPSNEPWRAKCIWYTIEKSAGFISEGEITLLTPDDYEARVVSRISWGDVIAWLKPDEVPTATPTVAPDNNPPATPTLVPTTSSPTTNTRKLKPKQTKVRQSLY